MSSLLTYDLSCIVSVHLPFDGSIPRTDQEQSQNTNHSRFELDPLTYIACGGINRPGIAELQQAYLNSKHLGSKISPSRSWAPGAGENEERSDDSGRN